MTTGFHALPSGQQLQLYKPSKKKTSQILFTETRMNQKNLQVGSATSAHTNLKFLAKKRLKMKLISHICTLSGWTFCFQIVIVQGWEQLHECFLSTGVRLPKIPEHVLVIDTI